MSIYFKLLNKMLAQTFALYFKSQNYHWIVKGENFYSLHSLFGSHYEELYKFVDIIAERIVAQDGIVDVGLQAMKSEIKDATHGKKWPEIIKDLILDHEMCVKSIKNALPEMQKIGDEGTFDVMIDVLKFHEKAIWMLKSHL